MNTNIKHGHYYFFFIFHQLSKITSFDITYYAKKKSKKKSIDIILHRLQLKK